MEAPSKKAEELVLKFRRLTIGNDKTWKGFAKQCAIICVKEMINDPLVQNTGLSDRDYRTEYLYSVLKHIKNL